MVKSKKISELTLLENNPRQISKENFYRLKKSLQRDPGFLKMRPVLAYPQDDQLIVYAGNQRVRAAKELGWDEIPVIIDEQANLEQIRQRILLDNVEFGEFDKDILANNWEIEELQELGLPELSGIVEELTLEPEAGEDNYEIPEEVKTDIVLGDLFEIGEHRLLCGDSTDSDQVAKLMNGEKADMVFTDPPYGVSYQSNMRTSTEKFDVLKNDNDFITGWINHLPLFSKGFVFVWTSWKVLKQWIKFCEPIGELSNLIVWDKGGGGIGDLKKTFSTDFELALVYNREAEIKGKRLGSVWSIGKDDANKYLHPTMKPVKLPATAIENLIDSNEIVLDLFLGSGSTMVAAHQLNRKCYGMELDPKYCQVIVDRMLKLDPTLTIKKNGKVWQPKQTGQN